MLFPPPVHSISVSGSLRSWGIPTAHHHTQGGGIMASEDLRARVIDLIA